MAIAKRRRRSRLEVNKTRFPFLNDGNHHCTSDPGEDQNCIAYAAGDDIHVWWPAVGYPDKFPPPYFWPKACDLEETIQSFACAYKQVGFESCGEDEDGKLEPRIEKLALYAKRVKDDTGEEKWEPTHAAIQSPRRNGKWRSKMGNDEDIEHDRPEDVSGGIYGTVVLFMKRTLAAKRAAKGKQIPSH